MLSVKQGWYHVPFFKSLVWLDLGLSPGLPGPLANTLTQCILSLIDRTEKYEMLLTNVGKQGPFRNIFSAIEIVNVPRKSKILMRKILSLYITMLHPSPKRVPFICFTGSFVIEVIKWTRLQNARAICGNSKLWMQVHGSNVTSNMDKFFKCLYNKNDSNKAGKALLSESSDVFD